MRLTSENPEFPWQMQTVSYICIADNEPKQIGADITARDAYKMAVDDKAKIIAVWPGRWRSDAFLVDNLDIFAKEKKLI